MQNFRKKRDKLAQQAMKKVNSRPKKSQKALKKEINAMQRLRKLFVAAQKAQIDAIESIPPDSDWNGEV